LRRSGLRSQGIEVAGARRRGRIGTDSGAGRRCRRRRPRSLRGDIQPQPRRLRRRGRGGEARTTASEALKREPCRLASTAVSEARRIRVPAGRRRPHARATSSARSPMTRAEERRPHGLPAGPSARPRLRPQGRSQRCRWTECGYGGFPAGPRSIAARIARRDPPRHTTHESSRRPVFHGSRRTAAALGGQRFNPQDR